MRHRGFATATVLGLLAIVALLSVSALHDALFGELLAGSRMLQQRATMLAQTGVQAGMARLGAMEAPTDDQFALQPLPDSQDSVRVGIQHTGSSPLAAGFSIGPFVVQHFQIESTGHSARGTRVTLVQGAARVMPAGSSPAGPSPAPTPAVQPDADRQTAS